MTLLLFLCLVINILSGAKLHHLAGETPPPDVEDSERDSCETDVYASKSSDDYVPCDSGWYHFRNKCYTVAGRGLSQKFSWSNAVSLCEGYGGDLVSIQSQEEQDFIVAYLQLDVKWWAWTGLNDRDQEGDYIWSDGSSFNYSNWRPGEPSTQGLEEYSRNDNEDCIHLTYDTVTDYLGKWNDRKCNDAVYAFCEKDENPRRRSPNLKYCSPEEGGGWKYENSCFHIIMQPQSWQNADRHCQATYNGHLLTIRDTLQDYFLELALPDIKSEIWIGIKKKDQLQQKWRSGWYVSYDRFKKDGRYQRGSCIARKSRTEWVTRYCTEELPFICEVTTAKPPVLKPPPKGAHCPMDIDDWRDLGGDYCYYIQTIQPADFFEASFQCQRRGGHLLSLHSQVETDMLRPFIEYNVRNPEYDKGFYIGLLRLRAYNEETFGWTDGSAFSYQNWNHNQPNRLDEKCVIAKTRNMKWNDWGCGEKFPGYICSVKKILRSSSHVDEPSNCTSFCVDTNSHLYGILSQSTDAKPVSFKKN